jgi:hypothetical protein
MNKIKAAVVGVGFIGAAHVEALRRLNFVEVAAIADDAWVSRNITAIFWNYWPPLKLIAYTFVRQIIYTIRW